MRLLYLLLLGSVFLSVRVNAQDYYKKITRDRVTVNAGGETVIAFIEPVKKDFEAAREKEYFWYSPGKIRSTYGGYDGKLLNGAYTSYFPDRNLKEKGEFKEGLRSGEWRAWYPGGKLREVVRWKNGVKRGNFLKYNEAGKVIQSGSYTDDQLNGRVIDDSDPDSTKISVYRKGKLIENQENKKAKKISLKQIRNNLKGFSKKLLKKKKQNSVVKRE